MYSHSLQYVTTIPDNGIQYLYRRDKSCRLRINALKTEQDQPAKVENSGTLYLRKRRIIIKRRTLADVASPRVDNFPPESFEIFVNAQHVHSFPNVTFSALKADGRAGERASKRGRERVRTRVSEQESKRGNERRVTVVVRDRARFSRVKFKGGCVLPLPPISPRDFPRVLPPRRHRARGSSRARESTGPLDRSTPA